MLRSVTPALVLVLVPVLLAAGCRSPEPFALEAVSATPVDPTTFRAGAAEVAFTPLDDYPLGGFGGGARREEFPFWLGLGWPGRLALAAHMAWHEEGRDERSDMLVESEGVHDDLTAKALVLRPDAGPPLALVRLDLIGVTAELQSLVQARVADLGYGPEGVFLTATHTHSGPGAFMRHPFACLVAMDNYRPELEARLVEAAAEAIRQAHEAAVPAVVGFARARDRGPDGHTLIAKNRRERRFRPDIAYDDLDDEIGLLLVRARSGPDEATPGPPLALVANYAVHPTVLGPDNLYFSGDLAHGLEDAVEARLGAPVLFVNGAEGDVGPRSHTHRGGLARCREVGERFADLVLPALDDLPLHPRLRLTSAVGTKELGSAYTQLALGRERFIDGDRGLGAWLTAPLTLPINAVLWTFGLTDVRVALTWNLALGVVGDLDGYLARHWTRLGGIRIQAGDEDVALLSLPGEGTHDVGLALRAAAAARGATRSFVLGLSQDHVGYIASREEYRRGGYEAWSTLFGEGTADQMLGSQEAILDALGYESARRPGER